MPPPHTQKNETNNHNNNNNFLLWYRIYRQLSVSGLTVSLFVIVCLFICVSLCTSINICVSVWLSFSCIFEELVAPPHYHFTITLCRFSFFSVPVRNPYVTWTVANWAKIFSAHRQTVGTCVFLSVCLHVFVCECVSALVWLWVLCVCVSFVGVLHNTLQRHGDTHKHIATQDNRVEWRSTQLNKWCRAKPHTQIQLSIYPSISPLQRKYIKREFDPLKYNGIS